MRIIFNVVSFATIACLAGCGDTQSKVADTNDSDDAHVEHLLDKDTASMSVQELVAVYRVKGADDYAGVELANRGHAAKREIISLLNEPKTSIVDRVSSVQILYLYFDPSDVQHEIDASAKIISEPDEREEFTTVVSSLRQFFASDEAKVIQRRGRE
jgi:hypothetical protein